MPDAMMTRIGYHASIPTSGVDKAVGEVCAVETERLELKYGRTIALCDLNLRIPEGAVFALVGPNGAGKTSLIKMLANLRIPSSGFARVLGEDSKLLRGDSLEKIGYISENQQLPGWMTVRYFLNYLRPFYPNWDRSLEGHLLRMLDISLEQRLKAMSRGQKMKVAFVGVLSYRPHLVILDEPFSGLDPLVREEIITVLKKCTGKTTFIISSHDLDEIEGFATHIGFLEKGRMLFSEEIAPLRRRFQRVEFNLERSDSTFVPPANWLEPEWEQGIYRFFSDDVEEVDSLRAEILYRLSDARNIQIAPMGLRQIFLTVARAQRANRNTAI